MNANSYLTTDELVWLINNSKEFDNGDGMGPYAKQSGNYIYVYEDWRDARDDDHKGRWFMLIPTSIESLAELTDREDWKPEIVSPEVFWPLVELVSKYAHTPKVFRETVLSKNDKEQLRKRLFGYFKDHTVSEDYRNGRLDAMRSVMGQFYMDKDYDMAKDSYKQMKLKAVNE